MYSRFSFPEPVNDSRLLTNSWRLKLDLVQSFDEDAAPGTVSANYELHGCITVAPGGSLCEVLALLNGFCAAQADKGGDHECTS
jgi:hypothetical protein